MRASPFNGALQSVIAPKKLRTDNKAGCAENSNGLRAIGCASKLRLCFSRSSKSAQTRRLSHSFKNRRKHRKVRDISIFREVRKKHMADEFRHPKLCGK